MVVNDDSMEELAVNCEPLCIHRKLVDELTGHFGEDLIVQEGLLAALTVTHDESALAVLVGRQSREPDLDNAFLDEQCLEDGVALLGDDGILSIAAVEAGLEYALDLIYEVLIV